jgi:hypothetical protein
MRDDFVNFLRPYNVLDTKLDWEAIMTVVML